MVCRMVQVGNWLLRVQNNKLGPSSSIRQFKKKVGNMWRHQQSLVLREGRETNHNAGAWERKKKKKTGSKWTQGRGWKEMVTNCKPRPSGICSSGLLCFLEYLQNYTHNKTPNFYLSREKIRYFP